MNNESTDVMSEVAPELPDTGSVHEKRDSKIEIPGQWLNGNDVIGNITVSDLRNLYQRLVRQPAFKTREDEYQSLHAVAMMQKAHFDDYDD